MKKQPLLILALLIASATLTTRCTEDTDIQKRATTEALTTTPDTGSLGVFTTETDTATIATQSNVYKTKHDTAK